MAAWLRLSEDQGDSKLRSFAVFLHVFPLIILTSDSYGFFLSQICVHDQGDDGPALAGRFICTSPMLAWDVYNVGTVNPDSDQSLLSFLHKHLAVHWRFRFGLCNAELAQNRKQIRESLRKACGAFNTRNRGASNSFVLHRPVIHTQ